MWGLKQPACGEREGVSHGGIGVIRWWGRCGGSMQQHHQLLHISHLISLRIVEARGDEEGMTVHTYTQPRVEARGGGVQKGRAWDCPALPPPPPAHTSRLSLHPAHCAGWALHRAAAPPARPPQQPARTACRGTCREGEGCVLACTREVEGQGEMRRAAPARPHKQTRSYSMSGDLQGGRV